MAEYYRIKGETVVSLADEARRLGNVEGVLLPAQMKVIFAGVTGTGDLPENARVYYVGNAKSAMDFANLNAEITASGTI
jgi:hypothetical protein